MLASFPSESVALVQGASRGIGLGLVHTLLECQNFSTVIATCRDPDRATRLKALARPGLVIETLDAEQPSHFEALHEVLRDRAQPLNLVINAAGLLHDRDVEPEKKIESLDAAALHRLFAVNAIAPALLLRTVRPFLARNARSVFAAVSARVGSISDNRLGGWYGYRASKAALNQFLRTASVELARRNRSTVVAALHPGTTDTDLSRPFQANVPAEKLFPVDKTVRLMLDVIDGLQAEDSGGFFAWDGQRIPW